MEQKTVHRLQPAVDKLLEGLHEPIDRINALYDKTDADFIDGEGGFSTELKRQNDEAISTEIEEYRRALMGRHAHALAVETGLLPVDAASFEYSAKGNLVLKSWNARAVGSRFEEPRPDLPEFGDEMRQDFFVTADFVGEIVDWWSSAGPLFVSFGSNYESATVFPSNGGGNVQTKFDRHDYDIGVRSDVVAQFEEGRRVSVSQDDGLLSSIKIDREKQKFNFPLLGWNGNRWAKPEDFRGSYYDYLAFIDEDGPVSANESVQSGTGDVSWFAVRAALGALGQSAEVTVPDVTVPDISEDFRVAVVGYLSSNIIRAFLPPKISVSTYNAGGSMTGYRAGVKTHVEANEVAIKTEQELQIILDAAGSNVEGLSAAVDRDLDWLRSEGTLAGRINAIRVAGYVREFLDSLK